MESMAVLHGLQGLRYTTWSLFAKLHVRHKIPGLDLLRILYPTAQMFGIVRDRSGSERLPAHQMREIGSEFTRRRCAVNRMAINARQRQESVSAILHFGLGGLRSLQFLERDPFLEI